MENGRYLRGGDGPPVTINDDGALACPSCGEHYGSLHHGRVRVRSRPCGEDGPAREVAVTPRGTIAEIEPAGWDGRRTSVRVEFSCEQCGDDLSAELCIMQHKGATYLEWVPA